jgi:hypothetical protein
MDINLEALTLTQVFGLLAIITLFDVVGSIIMSIVRKEFSFSYVAVWLQSHTLRRVFPIFALAVIGHGVGEGTIVPAIAPAFAMALAGLLAYVLETIKSLADSLDPVTPNIPTDTSPIPPQ